MALQLWNQEEVNAYVARLIEYGNESIVTQCLEHMCIPRRMVPLALQSIGIPVKTIQGEFTYIPDKRFRNDTSIRKTYEESPEYAQLFTGHVLLNVQ